MNYISLGAGVQSTALLILSARGDVPPADVAIFADTGDEPSWVYEHLRRLEGWSPIPIVRVSKGRLSEADHRFAAIPAFALGSDGRPTPLRRQCTREYKITPIERKVRQLLGYAKGQRVKRQATAMIGISLDEATRSKPSRTHWITNSYPLIDLRLRRSDCQRIISEAGFPPAKKSSCVFCPYHGDTFWVDLQENYPVEWERAVAFDHSIRYRSMKGEDRPIYLHRTLRPLDTVTFKGADQIDLFEEECEGVCGV